MELLYAFSASLDGVIIVLCGVLIKVVVNL